MNKNKLLPEAHWPRWKWWANTWLALIPCILGFIVFFFPELTEKQLAQNRVVVGALLLLLPLIVNVTIWLFKMAGAVFYRVRYYPQAHQLARATDNELGRARKSIFSLLQLFTNGRTLEILRARCDHGKFYIVLKRQRGFRIDVGTQLIVKHINDQQMMGEFEITEVRADEYYAVGVTNLDLVWQSFIRERGEVFTMPYLAAFPIPKGDE